MTSLPRIAIILLAAGGSRRMRGRDKLLEEADGMPLLRRVALRAVNSCATEVVTILGAKADERRHALTGLTVSTVVNDAWEAGMASSIAAGVGALSEEIDGAIILLGDMPDISAELLDYLVAAFDPGAGKDIVRPVAASGPVGNPILFGKRHFPALTALSGDAGAKPVIAANPDAVVDVETSDDGVLTDLDTPEAWSAWRSSQ